MDAEIGKEIKTIMERLESDAPGATEGLGALVGAASGGAVALGALSTLGVAGLSAAGITSGLATAGALVGGGMVAGIGVLASPIALLGIGGYWLANKWKRAKMIGAITAAIGRLHAIQERLLSNAAHYNEELATLHALIEALLARQKKILPGKKE